MKIFVKTLKGTHFDIEVKPEDAVGDVKKKIETVQGADVYPAAQQMLIHKGKVLKDETTLSENSVAENSFIVIMLAKTPQASVSPVALTPASTAPVVTSAMDTPAPIAESSPVASTTIVSESDVYGQAASILLQGAT
ncbi:hypothetical protein V6N13_108421 [Hibiscus sabdariffa]|uniref:Ubiquitin-like domain-containing protein n=1 Tax=Hibiscus sabdariffa TaxID=183260 RepID=A0ABR2SS54_9ROSI